MRGHFRGAVVALALVTAAGAPGAVGAAQIEDLSPDAELRVRDVVIEGSEAFPASALANEILTRERAWYTPWRSRPVFEPSTLETDLERLRRFYETRGYYEIRVRYELTIEGELVDVKLTVDENQPIPVTAVEVGVKWADALPLPETLPLENGESFNEPDYKQSESELLKFFLERSHAHVEVDRSATIDLATREARAQYVVKPGPKAVFGPSEVVGNEDVEAELVSREIEWTEGAPFSLEDIRLTRENLLALRLFRSVRIGWEKTADLYTAPMKIEVKEGPPREIKLGIGYSTEDQVRGQASWSHYNWLGGGRQLTLGLKLSFIESSAQALFVQPHFLARRGRGALEFRQDTADEDTYLLLASRFRPRYEYRFTRRVTGTVGYRVEFAKLSDVSDETEAALGRVREDGVSLGPSVGLVWDASSDPLNPKEGFVLSLFGDQIGDFWGGDYAFYRVTGEAKHYQPIGWQTTFATRLKLGVAGGIGGDENLPLFERFYAGGEKSVRGYGRRRLGPISGSDDPIGGLGLIEGSVELRRAIWQALGGALFVDFGQVSLDRDIPVGDLDFSAGPGVSYDTPVGPLRLDVGFPFDPPDGDSWFAVHFSIGAFF